jgi:hypothetical protein
MYHDPRFGTGGKLPAQGQLKPIALSYARYLFVRLSSPHETNESLSAFFDSIDRIGKRAWDLGWRFNFACALQPHQTATTPGIATICHQFKRAFLPERIRIVQIDPKQDGQLGTLLTPADLKRLWSMDVEIATVSGDRLGQRMNGWFLADYFDFT